MDAGQPEQHSAQLDERAANELCIGLPYFGFAGGLMRAVNSLVDRRNQRLGTSLNFSGSLRQLQAEHMRLQEEARILTSADVEAWQGPSSVRLKAEVFQNRIAETRTLFARQKEQEATEVETAARLFAGSILNRVEVLFDASVPEDPDEPLPFSFIGYTQIAVNGIEDSLEPMIVAGTELYNETRSRIRSAVDLLTANFDLASMQNSPEQ